MGQMPTLGYGRFISAVAYLCEKITLHSPCNKTLHTGCVVQVRKSLIPIALNYVITMKALLKLLHKR